MQIPYRQQRTLRRAERAIRQSDPRLAAMLAIFARLYASEVLTSPEQEASGRRMARLVGAVAWLAAVVSGCAVALSGAAAAGWRAVCGRPGAAQRSSARAG